MGYRIKYSGPAEREIGQAFEWILSESGSRRLATEWFHKLVAAIDSLQVYPERCPIAPEDDYFEIEVRQLLFGKRRGKYRILFTIADENVVILHVIHGARDMLR
ncbi:MAG: type II toxin-antitoxin system RelE/ParE family toxin [Candidatus Omnitrophica bacterium]|nr:type II toxin-antitoxin system RelE/ParE family toxin [Candidatus Omnitrophota bacterium]MCA9417986.1 type II toxin-antitoxin system RelE/ParE family toxin [Candidatus Omnitrophota bacterium]MCA9441501.1 type II toxin-antitoxin system RelE/ParE family toxin [Candidatus Omnitrophota bacterium]MCB9782838.1 type II toxin-antitoxin system RelE/ParE family toxin [Candidatus Omnitrophota bacterium]